MQLNNKKKTVYDLLLKIRGNRSYQYNIILVTLTIDFITGTLFNIFPLLETLPYVEYTDSEGIQQNAQLDYNICNENFIVDVEKTKKYSWVNEYKVYCNKEIISLLGWTMVGGSLIGVIFAQSSHAYGTRIIFIIGGFIFSIGIIIMALDNIKGILIGNFLLGIANGFIFITKNL